KSACLISGDYTSHRNGSIKCRRLLLARRPVVRLVGRRPNGVHESRFKQIQESLEEACLSLLSHRSIVSQAVGGHYHRLQFELLAHDCLPNIHVKGVGQLLGNDTLVSFDVFQGVPQQSIAQSQRRLSVRRILQQSQRRLTNRLTLLRRGRFRRLEPTGQSCLEIRMAVATLQGSLDAVGRTDQTGEIDRYPVLSQDSRTP